MDLQDLQIEWKSSQKDHLRLKIEELKTDVFKDLIEAFAPDYQSVVKSKDYETESVQLYFRSASPYAKIVKSVLVGDLKTITDKGMKAAGSMSPNPNELYGGISVKLQNSGEFGPQINARNSFVDSVEVFAAGLENGTVLDVGCGYGINTRRVLTYSKPEVNVVAIDIDPRNLAVLVANTPTKLLSRLKVSLGRFPEDYSDLTPHSFGDPVMRSKSSARPVRGVIFSHVAEFMDDESRVNAFKKIYQILAYQGRLFFQSPVQLGVFYKDENGNLPTSLNAWNSALDKNNTAIFLKQLKFEVLETAQFSLTEENPTQNLDREIAKQEVVSVIAKKENLIKQRRLRYKQKENKENQ